MRCKYLALAALSSFLTTTPTLASPEFSVSFDPATNNCPENEKVTALSYVRIHFHGTIHSESDSDRKNKHAASGFAYEFQANKPEIIKGFTQGVLGLCKGSNAAIIVPPDMGFGVVGAGRKIPPHATIVFVIDVIDVSNKPFPPLNVFAMLDKDNNSLISKKEYSAYFIQLGNLLPDTTWKAEDVDGDGNLSWAEFTLPKGDAPPTSPSIGDEL